MIYTLSFIIIWCFATVITILWQTNSFQKINHVGGIQHNHLSLTQPHLFHTNVPSDQSNVWTFLLNSKGPFGLIDNLSVYFTKGMKCLFRSIKLFCDMNAFQFLHVNGHNKLDVAPHLVVIALQDYIYTLGVIVWYPPPKLHWSIIWKYPDQHVVMIVTC